MFRKAIGVLSGIGGAYCIIGGFITKQSFGNLVVCILVGCAFIAIAYLLFKSAKKSEDKILKTQIIDATGRKSASSAVVRGAIGSAVMGPIGAVAGAVSEKENRETTFLIIYRDGHKRTKKVLNTSPEYKLYCKYLDTQ